MRLLLLSTGFDSYHFLVKAQENVFGKISLSEIFLSHLLIDRWDKCHIFFIIIVIFFGIIRFQIEVYLRSGVMMNFCLEKWFLVFDSVSWYPLIQFLFIKDDNLRGSGVQLLFTFWENNNFGCPIEEKQKVTPF